MEDMRKKLPDNVAREITRHKKPVFYHRVGKGKRTRLPDISDPEFAAAYAAACAGKPFARKKPGVSRTGTLQWLVTEYKKTISFRALDPITQRRRDSFYKQKELADLLDETDLSGIISAATLVADRLKFLEALRFILFDFEARQKLRERSQLHKILEQNTWIFGEEYNLWASDKELTTVLRAHRDKLDPDLVIDEPVKVINKSRGIVDLMLSRAQRRHRHNDLEHLVIELKAPKVVINATHLMQIEGYALAVEEDPRFNRVDGLHWHFWIISDEYDKAVQARIRNGPDPQRRLIQKGERVMVGVKTWGEVLEENNARLQFVKEKLEHRVDDGQALAYLQERSPHLFWR